MSDMVGTFNVQPDESKPLTKAMSKWNRYIDSQWHNPKNLYKASKTPAGKKIIRYGLGLL